MVIIWLMMVNNMLVGGWPTPLKKYEFVKLWHSQLNGKMFQTANQMLNMSNSLIDCSHQIPWKFQKIPTQLNLACFITVIPMNPHEIPWNSPGKIPVTGWFPHSSDPGRACSPTTGLTCLFGGSSTTKNADLLKLKIDNIGFIHGLWWFHVEKKL